MIFIAAGEPLALVDDDEVDRMIIKEVLDRSKLDNPAIEFSSAEAFIEHLERQLEAGETMLPVALMDINMPGMTGLQALEVIRSRAPFEHLPVVVMLSSSEATKDREAALRLGATAYITKQSGVQKFIETLEETFTNEEPEDR